MVQAAHNGIKSPGADNFMSLVPHTHRKDFSAPVIRFLVFCIDQGGNGRGCPGIQNRRFRNKFRTAAGTGFSRPFLHGIYRQPVLLCQNRFLTVPAVPERKGYPKIPLTGNAPVPFQIFHPAAISAFIWAGCQRISSAACRNRSFPTAHQYTTGWKG